MLGRCSSALLGFFLVVGCSAAPDPSSGGAGASGGGNSTSTSSGTGAGGDSSVGPGGAPNGSSSSGFGGVGTGGSGGFEECVGVSSAAVAKLQPADIIIAVDTSGSMDEEAAEVQSNLNDFAVIIANSGIDAHVVLIADASVCIPGPLGSGQCNGADENLPAYRHVVQTVSSSDSLSLILNTYPQWSSSLRAGASKTIAVISDDDSNMGAGAFIDQLLAIDPTFQNFRFDAIVSSTTPEECIFACFFNCAACTNPCCNKAEFCTPLSAAEGAVYKQLVQQTSGVFGDLCSQDFDPMFQAMATAVVQASEISCEYDIPAPPEGETLDPGMVNVRYTPGDNGPVVPLLNVPGGAGACDQNPGWYYDNPNNPTRVVVCPIMCNTLKADSAGKVDVVFGCETVVAVPR